MQTPTVPASGMQSSEGHVQEPPDLESQISLPVKSIPECQQQLQSLILGGISDRDCRHICFLPILERIERTIESWPSSQFLAGLQFLLITVTPLVMRQDIYDYICRMISVLSSDMPETLTIDMIWSRLVVAQALEPSDCHPEVVLLLQRLSDSRKHSYLDHAIRLGTFTIRSATFRLRDCS